MQTVWRRESKIYFDIPGMPENEIGEGKSCTIETIDNKIFFAWVENGNGSCIKTKWSKEDCLEKAAQPVLKSD